VGVPWSKSRRQSSGSRVWQATTTAIWRGRGSGLLWMGGWYKRRKGENATAMAPAVAEQVPTSDFVSGESSVCFGSFFFLLRMPMLVEDFNIPIWLLNRFSSDGIVHR
jgi:hypothetical protein